MGRATSVIPLLEKLADDAPFWDPTHLAIVWRDVERRVLEQLREEERQSLASAQAAHPKAAEQAGDERERIRNLAWEITVSIDLGRVHVRAISALAALLQARRQNRAGCPSPIESARAG